MSKLTTDASVSGTELSGAQLKAELMGLHAALHTAGLQEGNRSTITSDTTLTVTQCGLLLVDCTGGNVALTLPTSGTTTDDAIYNIRRLDNTVNTLTITRGGSDTIDGSASSKSVAGLGAFSLQLPAGGTDWKVFGISGSTAAAARVALGLVIGTNVAAPGANTDITSLSGVTAIAGAAAGMALSNVASVNSGQLAGFRNALINGNFSVNQRALGSNADDTYSHDRWYTLTQTGAIAVSTLTDVENGTPRMARLTQSQASAQRMGYAQIIEGINCKHLRGKQVTFRLGRTRLSSSANVRFAVLEWTGTEDSVTSDVVNDWTSSNYTAGNFFLGSNLTVSGVVQQALTAATLADGEEVTVTLGSSFNNLIVFAWTEATAAQNVTFDLGLAQLEIGAVASPFEHRGLSTELSFCNRYYERFVGRVTTAIASFFIGYGWKTTKRVTPTITVTPDTGTGAAATAVGTDSFYQSNDNTLVSNAIYAGASEL